MMKYFMPGMFTIFMMWLPSGLTLYILVNTVLTMIHQWYINKTDPIESTASSAPSGPGAAGASRGSVAAPSGRKRPSQEVGTAEKPGSVGATDSRPARRRSGKPRRRKKKT
jgi:membrane protein insertase Oxa1/YidC/SpoIIIJ